MKCAYTWSTTNLIINRNAGKKHLLKIEGGKRRRNLKTFRSLTVGAGGRAGLTRDILGHPC
jgi:hypothetical protein